MVKEIFTLFPNSIIEPCRISQDMLEGLFGTIQQLGGDSSTQTLKEYGHVLNKFQVTAKITSKIKSFNYRKSSNAGMEFNDLVRYDYRKKSKNNKVHINLSENVTQLSNMTSFTQQIFEELISNNLFMGKIEILKLSINDKINQQNQKILNFQQELIEKIFKGNFYENRNTHESTNSLLIPKNIITLNPAESQKFSYISVEYIQETKSQITNIIPKSEFIQYMIYLESLTLELFENHNKLVAYFLISKVIEKIFKGNFYENRNTHESTNSLLIPKNIITLNPAESQKFSYISVEYIQETKSQITNIIPKSEFIQYMIYLESLTLELFENHNKLGPNILQYVKNNLLSNSFLLEKFITTITKDNIELDNEELKFVYERCISIYMKSCQKTWRNVNNYIPKKGTASLRENLKTMRSNKLIVENKENKKSTLMKKINLPSDPIHALGQLRVWAQLEEAEDSFSKMFLVSELLWLVWIFEIITSYKRKKILVPIIIENLKISTPFIEEALNKSSIFME
ncbi:hypothetical protein Glove_142g18 [Diversispora epigaea]|uniref:Uncharacterized protein n=1 Tax=Diversispora epigaea TaxID=1348612 RepID=A0A397IZ64_9GLOM|nr:hypothetical protein Glove_142g18 [Diversispora epigaea]